jgi:antirestriction protein
MSPSIYVACLAAYNSGTLHGCWIDAAQEPEDLQADIDAMLARSPVYDAEEWAVHDVEDLPDLGEYPDLAHVARIAQGIEQHGEAFRAYLDWADDDRATVEDFEQRYIGEYRTRAEFAEQWLEDTGGLTDVPEHLQAFIDFDAYGRDMLLGGCVVNMDGHWFYND